ncbi:MAG: response regulator [Armatimonadota bacterium]|nr:response regulator [Armatimonadota bacterium]MDR5701974.1 response regulator [Armatimonadota bacterium]MDR7434728.1 response regulator [Armatimonadota bacterium]
MTTLRVLIVDDEAIIRMGLRAMLEEKGYQVVGEAGDGSRAVELARLLKPDLIFLDIKMPGMDGIETAATIMQDRPTPIILLTAYSDRNLINRAKEAGVLAYLMKPFKEADLVPTIEIALARFQEIQALRREVGDLKETLETRKLVERAKGILMKRYGLSEEEAFQRIQRQSRNLRKPMKEIAEAIILAEEI